MKQTCRWLALALAGALSLSLLAGCAGNNTPDASSSSSTSQETQEPAAQADSDALVIAEQGIFSAGGTVIESDGTFDVSNYYTSREGSTAHVDHANVLYQIPEDATELPMVFLHGYGQSRMGWMTTPDGREGWSDMFLRMGHSVWLIDQPRRGEAGQTGVAGTMTTTPSDQTWYTQFRIGTYLNDAFTYNEGSQFPQGEEVLDQFFRQMTPDTGMDNAAGDQNIDNAMVEQNIPVTFYYGDYIGEEFTDVPAAAMWSMMAASADTFTEAYNAAGGDSTMVHLPDEGITGNDHFMFQDLNNDVIADHIEAWIQENVTE